MKKLSSNLAKVVFILNDREYHDGDTIGAKLNITRTAVWKIIKKLENYQIKIDSVKGKGYALLEPLILLDEEIIKKSMDNNIPIEIFESIGSTNQYLKSFIGNKETRICLAEQ